MEEPRAKTAEEIRDEIFWQLRTIAIYWARQQDLTDLARCNGVVHSVLTLLDGDGELPSFRLVANSHPSDKEFHISQGEKWIEPGTEIDFVLHELYKEPKTTIF